jgi:hypothetical protein
MERPASPFAETDLYIPVKRFLEAQGFIVRAEVGHCDLVAVRPGEDPLVVIGELKLGFSLELLLQGADRMRACDAVFLAVRATRNGRDRDRRVHRLCRLLGFGLLAVGVRGGVEVLAEPTAYRPRPDVRRRKRLLAEHGKRKADRNLGGTRGPIMTAYREQALACAEAIRAGMSRPSELRPAAPLAGRILLDNHYGWFERVERGRYRLTAEGEAALLRWAAPQATGG